VLGIDDGFVGKFSRGEENNTCNSLYLRKPHSLAQILLSYWLLALVPVGSLSFYVGENSMKKLAAALMFAFLGSITLPVFAADEPKSPEDCKKMNAGDDAKIKACIDGLKK
jgi:hypothetical protein